MGLFDAFKKSKSDKVVEDQAKPSGGHGSHFDAAIGDTDLIKGLVMYALNEPDHKESFNVETQVFGKSSSLVVGTKKTSKSLGIIALTVNGQMYSAYPKNPNTIEYPVTIRGITEWQNGLESWATAKIYDAELTFFPLDYYKCKTKYLPGSKINVALSAFAYTIGKAEEKLIKNKEGKELSTKTMRAILPYSVENKNAFPDDYWFQGQITNIIEAGSTHIFKTTVAVFEKNELELWIYALSNNTAGDFKTGDYITGVLWLQGSIL